MKFWSAPNDLPSSKRDADLTTLLIALACLAAAALEMCGEVHHYTQPADSSTSKHSISDR